MSESNASDASATSVSELSLATDVVAYQNGRPVLIGSRCNECGALAFPKETICSHCLSESFTDEPMSERGKLYSWTNVHVGPQRMNKPIVLGYVDLDNGIRVFSHLSSSGRPLVFDQAMQLTIAPVGREADGRSIETFVFVPEGEQQ